MKAISAALIVLSGVVFLMADLPDTGIVGAGLMIVGFIYWILEMGRREN